MTKQRDTFGIVYPNGVKQSGKPVKPQRVVVRFDPNVKIPAPPDLSDPYGGGDWKPRGVTARETARDRAG